MEYTDFLKQKIVSHDATGFTISVDDINDVLFDWQKLIVRWALFKGRCAIFAGCGLGKTIMQLEWARHVYEHTEQNVLILAPLAVGTQTVNEGKNMLGLKVTQCRTQEDVNPGINITNYEMVQNFVPGKFSAIVLDESSILKGYNSKTRKTLQDMFGNTSYKLCCTATPAPNDHVELGNHSEFLNIMRSVHMLSSWFVNDGFQAGKWRLKGYAKDDFWRWVSTWAVCINKPSDLGFDDGEFQLPPLRTQVIKAHYDNIGKNGKLIDIGKPSATDMHRELRKTAETRTDLAAEMINASDDYFIAWCNTNNESELLAKKIPDAVEIKGSMTLQAKEKALSDFINKKTRVMIGKPSMCGFGLNLQHCSNMVFVGLSYSFEQRYQAVRRCWRFGQKREVNDYVIVSPKEDFIFKSVKEKEKKHLEMESQIQQEVGRFQNLKAENMDVDLEVKHKMIKSSRWTMINGDCVDETKKITSETIGFSIFSPPFSDLFVYSNSYRDMGNCTDDGQFMNHFGYLVPELYRVTIPGRLCAVHCSQLPRHKYKDGFVGMKDFRGDLIRTFESHGWAYHSEVCIWKDPVVEMQRTKAQGLLHKQVCKDATLSRQGMPDYLLVFRKHAEKPPDPVRKPKGFNPAEYIGADTEARTSIEVWQRYASPVWMDIRQGNVLNVRTCRTDKDQRHLCPLQLDVIERAIQLWTNKKDLVLSPFAGIGSEIYSAIKLGRKGYGIELKKEYYEQAIINLKGLDQKTTNEVGLLKMMEAANA